MCKFFNSNEESLHLGVCKLAKYVRNCVVFGKNYTDDKNFTRPPVATVATNFKSASHVEDYGNNNNCDDDEGQPGPSDDYENGGLGRRHLSHRTCCTPVAWVPCVATTLLHYLFLNLTQLFFSSSSLSLFSLCPK